MIHINSEDKINKVLEKDTDKLVVIMCSATWCMPCKKYAPQLDQMTVNYPDVTFLHVDVDEMEDYCKDVNVVPTFKFYKNGKIVFTYGGINLGQIKGNVDKLK